MRGCGQSEPQTSWSGLAATSASWSAWRPDSPAPPADAVRAGKLHPAAAFAERDAAGSGSPARRCRRCASVRPMWSITTGRPIAFRIGIVSGEVLHVDPELQVPAELSHDRREHPRGLERHAAAIVQLPVAEEMIEAQPAHAERMPAAQFGRPACRRPRPRRRAGAPARAPAHRASRNCRARARCPAPARRGRSRACRAARDISRAARPAACSCGRPHRGSATAGPNTWQCVSQAFGGVATTGRLGSRGGGQGANHGFYPFGADARA